MYNSVPAFEYKGFEVSEVTTSNCYDGCDVRCSHIKSHYYGKSEGKRDVWADTARGIKSKISRAVK